MMHPTKWLVVATIKRKGATLSQRQQFNADNLLHAAEVMDRERRKPDRTSIECYVMVQRYEMDRN